MQLYSELWMNWSWISCIPLTLCTIYRFATQETFINEKPKKYYLDDIFRMLLSPGLFYYTIDSIVLLQNYETST